MVKLRERDNWSGRFEVPSSWQSWRYVTENKGCLSYVLPSVLAFSIKYTFLKSIQFLSPSLSLQFHSPRALCTQDTTITFTAGHDSFSVPSISQSQPSFWFTWRNGCLPLLLSRLGKGKAWTWPMPAPVLNFACIGMLPCPQPTRWRKTPASWITCGRYTALTWDACHKPHTISGDSAVGFVQAESERALSFMICQSHLVMRCKKALSSQWLVSILQEHRFFFFLFFVVFTGTGTDPPSAVSVCLFSVTPANRQPQHKDEKQRENTWNFLLSG